MASNEALVLDGLAINDGTTYSLESVELTPPPELEEWIKGADSYGALLAREPLADNRIIEAQIRVNPQSTMDLALAKITAILDKLQECKRNANGLALTWLPADATLSAITFRCLSGQITGLPVDITSGWFVKAPLITVRMTCLPFGQGAEVLSASVTSGAPIITLELTGVAGDVPALGRLVVTDAASQHRRDIRWGLESRNYPTSSPPSLIVDSASMTTGTGFAGATGTRLDAYSGATNNVITATLRPQLQAICGLGNLSHVGAFRPQLRCYTNATTFALRLTYKTLDGPYRSLSYKVPAYTGYLHIDLGLITIPEAALGTQRWTGKIEAYSTGAGGETFEVDALWLMPAERYGRARAAYAYETGSLVALDQFTSITAGTVLNGRGAPVGGTWATSGVATDFAAADAPLSTDETMTRATTSEATFRLAVLGSTNYTNTEAAVDCYFTGAADANPQQGVIVRYVDASNYLYAYWAPGNGLFVVRRVAGVETTFVGAGTPSTQQFWRTVRLVVFPSGAGRVVVLNTNSGETIASASFFDSNLATGGALATGKPGFLDKNAFAIASTRYYDNFYAAAPPDEPIVCYSGQSIEFRHNATLRKDATGTYAGDPPEYVGARFMVPPAGGPARKARIAVIARRRDIEVAQDDDLTSNATTDSTTVQAYVTPQYVVVPR